MSDIQSTSLRDLANNYDGILLDAYGVLVDAEGPCTGAAEALAWLTQEKKPFWIVTNDASRLPSTNAARLRGFGLPVGPEQIISSGALFEYHLRTWAGREPAQCCVLGTEDSARFVELGGGKVVDWNVAFEREVTHLVVADESGTLPSHLEDALNLVLQASAQGRNIECILLNPDRIFPRSSGAFGLAAGSLADLLESAWSARLAQPPRFVRYGKPGRELFDLAKEAAKTERLVMVGDQLKTDIAGAAAAGLDSALTTWGVTSKAELVRASGHLPQYILESWF